MNRHKVMYVAYPDITMTGLHQYLEDYTKYNGIYPDFIDMPTNVLERYKSILIGGSAMDSNKLTFCGIKIR